MPDRIIFILGKGMLAALQSAKTVLKCGNSGCVHRPATYSVSGDHRRAINAAYLRAV